MVSPSVGISACPGIGVASYSILIFISYIPRSRDLYKDSEELKKKKNLTLEHYTNYKASDLKTVVLALVALQLNTKASSLNAIRVKHEAFMLGASKGKHTNKEFDLFITTSPIPDLNEKLIVLGR
ncbi:hypothetical protein S83_055627, partial [Arachis hypogaea]